MPQATSESARTAVGEALELLVLWQNPISRRYRAIGRLSFDGNEYVFGYTQGAKHALEEGFRGLPGLRKGPERYTSPRLFPFFAQRTLDPTRPDYEGYLDSLGLDAHALPLEQMLHSGGSRAADTIQLIQRPKLQGTSISLVFLAHGVRHVPTNNLGLRTGPRQIDPSDHEAALAGLETGEALTILEEPNNEYDPLATLVATEEGTPLGYVPRELCRGVQELARNGNLSLKVLKSNGPGAPDHLRLLVQLHAESVEENPFDSGDWAYDTSDD